MVRRNNSQEGETAEAIDKAIGAVRAAQEPSFDSHQHKERKASASGNGPQSS